MKLKSSYDNFEAASNETALYCEDPSLTQQHDEFDSNINNIVSRYIGTGQLQTHNLPPLQGDFSQAPDMQSAMNLGIQARDAFMEQPANIRAKFDNDPARFVDFCSNQDNIMELHKLGLLNDEANERIISQQARARDQAARDKEDAERYRSLQKAQQ